MHYRIAYFQTLEHEIQVNVASTASECQVVKLIHGGE